MERNLAFCRICRVEIRRSSPPRRKAFSLASVGARDTLAGWGLLRGFHQSNKWPAGCLTSVASLRAAFCCLRLGAHLPDGSYSCTLSQPNRTGEIVIFRSISASRLTIMDSQSDKREISPTSDSPSMAALLPDLPLEGTVLDGQFRVGGLLKHENHFDVYSLSPLEPGDERVLEARVFALDNIPSKVRKRRIRTIKRMESKGSTSRRVLQTRSGRFTIIVYEKDPEIQLAPATAIIHVDETLQIVEPAADEDQPARIHAKSDHRRASNRQRQLERRRARRQQDNFSSFDEPPDGLTMCLTQASTIFEILRCV